MTEVINDHPALRLNATVQENGHIEFIVPYPKGAKVTVLVMEDDEPFDKNLLEAAGSSLAFWDNPEDDEDWNNV